MTLIALDIETACALGCAKACDHALDEYRNKITVIGVYSELGARTFRGERMLDGLNDYLSRLGDYGLVGHGLKFDLKTLAAHGLDLPSSWSDDTLLMASVLTEKVPESYLSWYSSERKRLNAAIPRGYSHREGSQHSLKVLAPYFLGVPPFWEDPTNHDNDAYVLKDCEYTHRLYYELKSRLESEESYEFYKTRLLPWTAMLLAMERQGILVDGDALANAEQQAMQDATQALRALEQHWEAAFKDYAEKEKRENRERYGHLAERAISRLKRNSPESVARTHSRYGKLCAEAEAKLDTRLNLDSPTQLTWLLRDHLKLDITDFDGDETTGKAVLQKLASTGREDIKEFIRYRKAQKLSTAFFPSYREMAKDGVIHCSFNPTGTRTGRLSSSRPNLQQVERGLHKLFVARPGYKLATFDMSAIEPRLIAFYTHDLNLWDILDKGQDFHGYNTKIFFDLECEVSEIKKRFPLEREVGKEVGLAIMYGAGHRRLMESAQKRGFVWSERQARHKVDRFKEFYEGVWKFRNEVIKPALMQGPVTNLLGRKFAIQDPSDVYMTGLNTLIQGSASDLVVHSAYRIMKAFAERGIDGHVLLLVHDEIVTEIPEDREEECVEIIKHAMTDYDLPTPLGPVKLAVEGKVAKCWEK